MSTGTTGREQPEAAPRAVERHLRADAQRNRERILEAATTLMATQGIDVPIDEIAQLAQVGVGTVYRNFPTKGALFEALLIARISPACRRGTGRSGPARTRATPSSPLSASCAMSSRTSRRSPTRWPRQGVDLSAAKHAISGELIDAVDELLERAQEAGRIRPDVTITDISAMMAGLSHTDPSFMDASQRSAVWRWSAIRCWSAREASCPGSKPS